MSKSVVLVWFQESDRGYASYGTGFALDSLGHILTCAHVVQDKEMVTVAVPVGDQEVNYPARVIDIDRDIDAALLKVIGAGLEGLAVDDGKPVRAGERVGFVGYPLGYTVDTSFGPSVTVGFVSAVRQWRVHPAAPRLPMIQVDGTVAIGTSGSPLFRVDTGAVVGMMKSHVRTPGPIGSGEDVLGEIESVPDKLATYTGIGLALPIGPLAKFAERNGVQLVR
jgi:S1-C subfamily serine protease